jgi:hypothetical protein
LSAPWFSDSAVGGNRVESLPSREPSAPSPSWFWKASGALESAGATSAAMGPSLGRGGREDRIRWPYNKVNTKYQQWITRITWGTEYFFEL